MEEEIIDLTGGRRKRKKTKVKSMRTKKSKVVSSTDSVTEYETVEDVALRLCSSFVCQNSSSLTDKESALYTAVLSGAQQRLSSQLGYGGEYISSRNANRLLAVTRELCGGVTVDLEAVRTELNRLEAARPGAARDLDLSDECAICLSVPCAPLRTPCDHVYCTECIYECMEEEQEGSQCPLCRTEFNKSQLVSESASSISSLDINVISTKHALVESCIANATTRTILVSIAGQAQLLERLAPLGIIHIESAGDWEQFWEAGSTSIACTHYSLLPRHSSVAQLYRLVLLEPPLFREEFTALHRLLKQPKACTTKQLPVSLLTLQGTYEEVYATSGDTASLIHSALESTNYQALCCQLFSA